MKNLNLFILVIAVLAMVACGEKTDTAKMMELQMELSDSFDREINAGNADALAMIFSDDAIRMLPNIPMLKGREAIRANFKSFLDQYTIVNDNKPAQVVVSGDYVYSWGIYVSDYKLKSGNNAIHDEGKFIVISKLQPDGSLKIIIEIWNSDLPTVGNNQ